MEIDEVKEVFDDLKAKGKTNEEIAGALGQMFIDDEITKDQLIGLCQVLGLEVTDKFKEASDEEAKDLIFVKDNEKADVDLSEKDREEIEENPFGKDAPSDKSSGTDSEDEDEDEDEESDEDEEEKDKDKAFKLMGLEK